MCKTEYTVTDRRRESQCQVSPLYVSLLLLTYFLSFLLSNFVCSFVCLLVFEDEYSG